MAVLWWHLNFFSMCHQGETEALKYASGLQSTLKFEPVIDHCITH